MHQTNDELDLEQKNIYSYYGCVRKSTLSYPWYHGKLFSEKALL